MLFKQVARIIEDDLRGTEEEMALVMKYNKEEYREALFYEADGIGAAPAGKGGRRRMGTRVGSSRRKSKMN